MKEERKKKNGSLAKGEKPENISPVNLKEIKAGKKKTPAASKEWAVLERESFLSNIFASIQDGISILDRELNIIRVNPTMEKWYRQSMPLVGKKCYKAYHGTSAPCETCPALHVIKTGKSSFDIIPRRDAEGEIIGWLNLFSFPLIDTATGEMMGVIEHVRDITDQRRAEDALRVSEERFRALIESTSDWIWEIDLDDVYTYASPKIKDLLGYEPEQVIGKTPFDFMSPDEAERVTRVFKSLKQSGLPINALENVNLHKNGRRVVVETSGLPFFDPDGNLRGYRGIDRDISHRKQDEEALQRKEKELQKRVKELENFYAIAVGRELRMIQLKKEIGKLKQELEKHKID
jgi:PAS domain S-box-containing protein